MPSENRQELFQPDLKQGTLRRPNGQRVAALSLAFVQSLHASLLDQFGDNAADLLYRSGYEWGLQEMVRLNQHIEANLGGGDFDVWQMDQKTVLDSWWAPLAEAGWGHCAFDVTAAARGIVFVELRGSVVASALTLSDQPICHFYAGLFAGALSFYDRLERHAVEVQCRAVDHPSCHFIVGAGPDVDSAETWRQKGIAPAEIIRRLR